MKYKIENKPFQTKGEKDWGFIKKMRSNEAFYIEGKGKEARNVSAIQLLRRYAKSVGLKVKARKEGPLYLIHISKP